MIYSVDPRQNRLFDPFEGIIPPAGRRLISESWQGVVRHVLLELMPVSRLATHFSPDLGAPTKELYSMAALIFLADFHGWTPQEAVEAYIFRSDVQYALNLEPGVELSTRTVERYQKLFREDDLAAQIFHDVTIRLADMLELDVAKQRLDSTHVFSHMATFGRTKLMAVAIKRFLTQVKRHDPAQYDALPEVFRRRYEQTESRLFAGAKDQEARLCSRQQAAEDLLWTIERFAECADMTGRSSYKALVTIFGQQCEVQEGKITVKAKPGGHCMQNPSDLNAGFGHKGPGYQAQIAETCGAGNEVQLITGVLPQSAAEPDQGALVPMLDQLEQADLLPEQMMADTHYGGDESVQAAAERGVDVTAPVRDGGRVSRRDELTVDDFALDERTGQIECCPQGHTPLVVQRDEAAGTTHVEMPASACAGCPFRSSCPIERRRDGRYTLDFSDKDHRLAARRREQETEVFAQRYAKRAGIESTNSGLKNRLGLGRLRVRGRGSVFRVIQHKAAGWNVLRAAASTKLRAWVKERVNAALKGSETAPFASFFGSIAVAPRLVLPLAVSEVWLALALAAPTVPRITLRTRIQPAFCR